MKRSVLLFMVIGATHPLAAQDASTRARVLAARDTVWNAWFRNDTTLLKRFVPPAAVVLDGAGKDRWSDRKAIMGNSRGFVQSRSRLLQVKFANTQIALSGQSALVRSQYQTVVESGGRRDTSQGRATELFVLVGDTWVNPYWQLEPINDFIDAGREVPLPDTLGANFDIADSARALGTPADYDALLGTWEFRYQGRRANGTFNESFTGHWSFEKKPGGGLIEDHWRPDDPTIEMGISLYTYRVFDAQRKVWQMIGTSSYGGDVQPGLTWSDAKHRYAIQRAGATLTRIRYLAIDADHFLWRSDRSSDGGKTWFRDVGTMEARRIGK